MIGYVCKYTPLEIIESFGENTVLLETDSISFGCAECDMHSNICSYAKGVYEKLKSSDIKKVVLVNCCDSIRRLYDVLKEYEELEYLYLMDLPRKKDEKAIDYFIDVIEEFVRDFEKYTGKSFLKDDFYSVLKGKNKVENRIDNEKGIAISGARIRRETVEVIENLGIKIIKDLTCTGENREFETFNSDDVLKQYCSQLLNMTPCMRMDDTAGRLEILKDERIEGIIYQTVKFCDFYGYEYAKVLKEISKPVLKLESDYVPGLSGQLVTRLEAFAESVGIKTDGSQMMNRNNDKGVLSDVKGDVKIRKIKSNKTEESSKPIYAVGIDIGSTSANVVIMDENMELLSYSIERTGAKSVHGAHAAMESALHNAGLKKEDVSYTVATGYGRTAIDFADEKVTEITCHGKGAVFTNPAVRTVIDIGGQDSKVIKLDGSGNILDFVMNDKCAAGTGKFLEMMSRTLEIEIENLGKESLKSSKNVNISSMCTVFAESEVISLIADNTEKPDIIKGLCNSIASRTSTLVNRVGKEDKIMMTGGVAKNIGVAKSIEEKLGLKLVLPEEPQIIGALGAAAIAVEKLKNNS